MKQFRNLLIVTLGCSSLLLGTVELYGLQLGSRSADEWIERLERTERVENLKIDDVISRLELKPGDVVTDLGAGTGVFSRPLARAVGTTGKVLAVEIDQALLDHINQRAQEENLENIEPVLGKFEDPNLPRRDVDLAFFHDVLHHIEKREAYLRTLSSYLKPTARIVVIDLIEGHRDNPELQITQEQVTQWMASVGFQLMEEVELFEDKFFVIYSRNP